MVGLPVCGERKTVQFQHGGFLIAVDARDVEEIQYR